MSPATGFSYHRLHNESESDNNNNNDYEEEIKRAIDQAQATIIQQRSSSSSSFRILKHLKRVHIRKNKKLRKMKIPSLRKFMRRIKARVVMVSMANVLKRLKDSQSHFGDLFAGNYLFMQVNPTPLKPSSSSSSSSSQFAINHHHGSIKRLEDELHHRSTTSSARVS